MPHIHIVDRRDSNGNKYMSLWQQRLEVVSLLLFDLN